MTDLRPVKHELERLVLARGDIASAAAAWTMLGAFEELRSTSTSPRSRNISWDDAWWSLWTGAVVSYARPFTQSRSGMTLGKRWWGRIDDQDARDGHQWVMGFRHTLWAHTEQEGHRNILVSQSGVTEQRTRFGSPLNFPRLRRLCDYWLERLDNRIDVLVNSLGIEGVLPPGGDAMPLDDVQDVTDD